MRLLLVLCDVLAASLIAGVAAQSSSPRSEQPSPSPSLPISLSLTTSTATVTTTSRAGNQLTTLTRLLPTTFNVTHTITPTSSSTSPSTTSSQSASATPNPYVLETRVDPAFGVLGALLIITGLPSAFWGHKNRWTSFFLIGFYTLSLVCFVLILKFGILAAVNPPSKTLRGLFLLSSAIAGFAGGAIAIFFWKAARYGIGAWGGFAVGLWVQCFRNGGLIHSSGLRWILYIGCAVVGFVLCTIPRIHYHILLLSTAMVGASAFMLGVDCFTTAGLKEFYVWNLGFKALFPRYVSNGIQFPVSQTMQIELGLIGAVALMGTAVQLRILGALRRKLEEIQQEQRRRDEEEEMVAAQQFETVQREQDDWEREHGKLALPSHGRHESGLSTTPLLKDKDESISTLVHEGARKYSNASDFKSASSTNALRPMDSTGSGDEGRPKSHTLQVPGVLPALDLGLGIQDDVPSNFIANEDEISDLRNKDFSPAELQEIKRKEGLMLEIQTIRKSIEALKSDTPSPETSRRPSMTSRRTLSIGAQSALLPSTSPHLRPPRETDPRSRVRSMELSNLGFDEDGGSISRPASVPIRDDMWDNYIQERKLLQPPAGVTPPIATSPVPNAPRAPVPAAVTDALQKRKQREDALGHGRTNSDISEDIPLAKIAQHRRSSSAGGSIPVTILPPKRQSIAAPTPQRPDPARVRTFEELNERHREKMRNLQAPISEAQREQAEVSAARQRWERNKAIEKSAVDRRQAEQIALQEKKRHGEPRAEHGRRSSQHVRSASADRLGGSSSKRMSLMKVEDWQRYQQQEAEGSPSSSRPKRDSRVPFPDGHR